MIEDFTEEEASYSKLIYDFLINKEIIISNLINEQDSAFRIEIKRRINSIASMKSKLERLLEKRCKINEEISNTKKGVEYKICIASVLAWMILNSILELGMKHWSWPILFFAPVCALIVIGVIYFVNNQLINNLDWKIDDLEDDWIGVWCSKSKFRSLYRYISQDIDFKNNRQSFSFAAGVCMSNIENEFLNAKLSIINDVAGNIDSKIEESNLPEMIANNLLNDC